MANNQTTDVELEGVEAQYWVDQNSALERLMENDDFKNLILDGYCRQKALEGVSLLAVPAIKQAGQRADIMEDLVAISNLKYHFEMVKNLGSIAQEDLEDTYGPDVE